MDNQVMGWRDKTLSVMCALVLALLSAGGVFVLNRMMQAEMYVYLIAIHMAISLLFVFILMHFAIKKDFQACAKVLLYAMVCFTALLVNGTILALFLSALFGFMVFVVSRRTILDAMSTDPD